MPDRRVQPVMERSTPESVAARDKLRQIALETLSGLPSAFRTGTGPFGCLAELRACLRHGEACADAWGVWHREWQTSAWGIDN